MNQQILHYITLLTLVAQLTPGPRRDAYEAQIVELLARQLEMQRVTVEAIQPG